MSSCFCSIVLIDGIAVDSDADADAVSEIPEGERTITKVFSKAVFKKPSLVVDVVRVFAGV